jgi:hypothetical protein
MFFARARPLKVHALQCADGRPYTTQSTDNLEHTIARGRGKGLPLLRVDGLGVAHCEDDRIVWALRKGVCKAIAPSQPSDIARVPHFYLQHPVRVFAGVREVNHHIMWFNLLV